MNEQIKFILKTFEATMKNYPFQTLDAMRTKEKTATTKI